MGRTIILWFLLLLPLSLSVPSVSSIETLNSISELADNNVTFGQTFPRHGLKLLYWLANIISIDNNNVIDLGNIVPSQGHYGFHNFSNKEKVFPINNDYYTLGNLNSNRHRGSAQLPESVIEDYKEARKNLISNADRIVVQSFSNNSSRVKRVYITIHYNPNNTWEISHQLLREIQNIPERMEFLTQAGYDFNSVEHNVLVHRCTVSEGQQWEVSFQECDTKKVMTLAVQPGYGSNAMITWKDIPYILLPFGMALRVYDDMDGVKVRDSYSVGHRPSGFMVTNLPLHHRMQVRLESKPSVLLTNKRRRRSANHIWASPEFDEGNRKLPTKVVGYDASLQLFVKHGKACARLYIKRSFTDWKDTFKYSWVGIYKTSDEEHDNCKTWQSATKFNENQNRHTDGYLSYEYDFGSDIHHDVQARFFLQSAHSSVRAQSQPWGNKIISKPTDVDGYGASLQLFAKKGKACVRLYIQRSFTDWRDKFFFSWIGFYKHTDDGHCNFYRYQFVFFFKENPDKHTETALAYEYESFWDIQYGLHVRLFLRGYTSLLAETLPWGEEAIGEI